MSIKDKHSELTMADERVKLAQTALDEAIREHWMASQQRVKAEEEYYAEVKGLQRALEERLRDKFDEPIEKAVAVKLVDSYD